MNIDLTGRKALVCGSTQGIGFAIAQKLNESGAEVTLLARNEASLRNAVESLGEKADYLVSDFEDFDSLLNLRDKIEGKGYDILVNNAGGPPPGLVTEARWDEFERAFNMHLKVSHHLTQWLIPDMKMNGFGRIINVISTSVRIPIPGLGVSNTVRGSVASWSKTLSNEVAKFGVTVNNILPGPVNTKRLEAIIHKNAEKNNIDYKTAEDRMKAEVPAGRFGEPEELGALATFLSSNHAGFINGVNIPVDGGRTGSI